MEYEIMFEQEMVSIKTLVETIDKVKEENCDLYALIYMRGWLKGIVEDLDKIIP